MVSLVLKPLSLRRVALSKIGWKSCFVWMCLAALSFPGCASSPKPATPATPPPTSATAGQTTIVAIQPSGPSPGSGMTLPKFLGLDGAARGIGGGLQRIGSRLMGALDLTGRFPGLQPQPPVLPITAPDNMTPDAPPAVQAAAEIKKEEDSAQQKVMAIRYLATLGCGGCYEKVEDALLEGLSDCTELVRYEAVRALQCKPECGCRYCSSPSCCSSKVRKKLDELTRCEKEPSARIRRHARLALACCATKPLDEDDVPREGPTPAKPLTDEATIAMSKNMFEGIQLVSFQASSSKSKDMVLAVVNNESITKSQIAALLDHLDHSERSLIANEENSDERLRAALQKAIDWKIMEQQARNEVKLAGGSTSVTLSPSEIQNWFEKRVQTDSYIASTEIAAFYDIHRAKFVREGRVRWEELVIYVSECSSRQEAMALAETLRRRAEGYQADPATMLNQNKFNITTYCWMAPSKAESKSVAKFLETLPIGQVGPVIEDNDQMFVVRVLERQPAETRPLQDCAVEIQQAILAERRAHAEQRTLAELRTASSIWTVFTGGPNADIHTVQTASDNVLNSKR